MGTRALVRLSFCNLLVMERVCFPFGPTALVASARLRLGSTDPPCLRSFVSRLVCSAGLRQCSALQEGTCSSGS